MLTGDVGQSSSTSKGVVFTAALAGGLVTAALMVAIGAVDSGETRTIVQQAPLAAASNSPEKVSDTDPSPERLTPSEIYKRDAPGVVFIRAQTISREPSPFDLAPVARSSESTGSGFVVDEEGYIVTNAHVVSSATAVQVSFSDKQAREAKIIGKDESTDLAMLKVDPAGLDLEPLELGDSSTVQVGDPTIAIGNPFGLERTLTTGVVSALQRRIYAPNDFSIEDVIQTDAAINPGNSGGPLIDATGRVIGINSQIATAGGTGGGSGGSIGIGFAVPVNTAKKVMPELRTNGRVRRAWLGIDGIDINQALAGIDVGATSGVLVQGVKDSSPAEKAGLRAGSTPESLNGGQILIGGDVITSLDGRPVKGMADVIAVVEAHKPGDIVQMEIKRDGETIPLTITLEDRPEGQPTS